MLTRSADGEDALAAGGIELQVRAIAVHDDHVEVKGTLGVWDATILFDRAEIRRLIRVAPKAKLVGFMFRRSLSVDSAPATMLCCAIRRPPVASAAGE
jgi:predicted transcriptional regulator